MKKFIWAFIISMVMSLDICSMTDDEMHMALYDQDFDADRVFSKMNSLWNDAFYHSDNVSAVAYQYFCDVCDNKQINYVVSSDVIERLKSRGLMNEFGVFNALYVRYWGNCPMTRGSYE